VRRRDNQHPKVEWRDEGGRPVECKVGSWRLKEGKKRVFAHKPRSPLSWQGPSINEIADARLMYWRWWHELEKLREALAAAIESRIQELNNAASGVTGPSLLLAREKIREITGYDIQPPKSPPPPWQTEPMLTASALERSFRQWSIAANRIIVVHFGARWAGPCEVVREEWKSNLCSDEHYKIFDFNVEDEPEMALALAISAVPTILIFAGGRRIYRDEGAIDSAKVQSIAKMGRPLPV
jgi:hypothetical protein